MSRNAFSGIEREMNEAQDLREHVAMERKMNRHTNYDYEDYSDFADPGSNSALRAASSTNPRDFPCPSCGAPNRLTAKDRALGYQCNDCANHDEGYGPNGAGEY